MTEKELFHKIKDLAKEAEKDHILVSVVLVSIMNGMKYGYMGTLADVNRTMVDFMSDEIVDHYTGDETKH